MYGVTHVCVNPEDIRDLSISKDGVYEVFLAEAEDSYVLFDKSENKEIGHTKKDFLDRIHALEKEDEIDEAPAAISKVSIKKIGGKVDVLGMGHLEFLGY